MHLGIADLNVFNVEVQRLAAGALALLCLFILGSGRFLGCRSRRLLGHNAGPVAVALFVHFESGVQPVQYEGIHPRGHGNQ